MKQKKCEDATRDDSLNISKGIILDVKDVTHSQINTTVDNKKHAEQHDDQSQLFTISICPKIKLTIFKPLIPLKISLFLWFGVGAIIQAFLSVYLKQRGMTIDELSIIYIILPVVQLLGSVLCGVIADKIGKSKPVLVANLLLGILFLIGIRLVPSMSPVDCGNMTVDLRCYRLQYNHIVAETSCGIDSDPIHVRSCQAFCTETIGSYNTCDITRKEQLTNFSLSMHVNNSYISKGACFYNVNSLTRLNSTLSWCDVPHNTNISISCTLLPGQKCALQKGYRTQLYLVTLVLVIMFMATLSITYRFFDVTSMCLVNDYDKDFGRERVWSILGILVCSPIGGLIVSATSRDGEPKNYGAALYFAIALALATLCSIWKLNVHIRAPGKHLWKKSLKLLKNPDVISFVFILFILGATWSYTKLFMSWYLDDLKASSFLIGILPAVGSLYGLPFLHTSRWWINKIGHTNVFLLALLGGMLSTLGYSFLKDPWWSIALEVTQIFSYHLLWVAVIVHSHSLAPEGLTATVLSSAGAIHYGIGKGSGSLIGGLSMKAFGGRTAFRIISVMCLGSAVLYALYLFFRKIYVKRIVTLQIKDDTGNINKEVPVKVLTLQDTWEKNEKD